MQLMGGQYEAIPFFILKKIYIKPKDFEERSMTYQ